MLIRWWVRRREQRIEAARPLVLARILAEPHRRHYAHDLSKELGIRTSYLYPALHELLEERLIADGWEDGSGPVPPRRYYQAPLPGGQGQS